MGDDESRPETLGLAAVALHLGGRPFIGLDRLGELLLDPGAEHLDRDLAPFGRHRAMDLGDGCGADRNLVELEEQAFERGAKRLFDRLLDRLKRSWRQVVLELREVLGGLHPQGRGGSTAPGRA